MLTMMMMNCKKNYDATYYYNDEHEYDDDYSITTIYVLL